MPPTTSFKNLQLLKKNLGFGYFAKSEMTESYAQEVSNNYEIEENKLRMCTSIFRHIFHP